MQWNFQKIQYFLKVAETLNFSKAARELYISPQSLHKQIMSLEEELGEPLFWRTTRRVELTALGRELQKVFQPVQTEFVRADAAIEKYFKRQKRTVKIAFFQAISKKEAVTPITNYLRACDRNIQVELHGGEMDEMIDWLYDGSCDLVITNIHPFETWNDAEIIPFVETPAKIVVSLYHPWNVKGEITMEDLESVPVLLLERKKELEEDSFYRNLQAKERLYAPNFSSLLANLEVESCYAVIPRLFESMNQAGLQFLDLPKECHFDFKMVAIYRKENRWAHLFENLHTLAEEHVIQIKE